MTPFLAQEDYSLLARLREQAFAVMELAVGFLIRAGGSMVRGHPRCLVDGAIGREVHAG